MFDDTIYIPKYITGDEYFLQLHFENELETLKKEKK